MKITLTEDEANFLILKALNIADSSKLAYHSSGACVLHSPHSISIVKGIRFSEDIPDEPA